MGLYKHDNNELESTKNGIYGVLPYIALEVLRRQNYSKASDIYNLRPRFNIKVPKSFVHLIKRCLDANPSNRPTDNYYERYGNIIESLQTDILSEN
ncbi:kinase-like domain-containing protein [Rhizophagus clarus]|uniref:Kinase-like domain-containing protein n=1 Tax=Rhizophagus clarus TaxID=94130 RepID=A0A8H3KSI0_9GLOM|nr:kinase-like domain-containing protein [Rhizophagus clarus]